MAPKHDLQREPMSRLLLRAYRYADRSLVDALEHAEHRGVGAARWELVAYIGEEGARAADLARELGMTKQAIAQTVKYLESAGYVARRRDPQDGRARTVHLTAYGEDLRRAGEHASLSFEARLREELGRTRVRALKETLDELVRVPDES